MHTVSTLIEVVHFFIYKFHKTAYIMEELKAEEEIDQALMQ